MQLQRVLSDEEHKEYIQESINTTQKSIVECSSQFSDLQSTELSSMDVGLGAVRCSDDMAQYIWRLNIFRTQLASCDLHTPIDCTSVCVGHIVCLKLRPEKGGGRKLKEMSICITKESAGWCDGSHISCGSPLGRALIGLKDKDNFEFEQPKTSFTEGMLREGTIYGIFVSFKEIPKSVFTQRRR